MKKLIVANWKMNPASLIGARKLFSSVKKTKAVICPPLAYLTEFNYKPLGAQNCHWQESGPYTGEVSPKMLKDLGVEYVIIGHSERRIYFKETDEIINKKLKAALKAGLKPILCIGEKTGENSEKVIINQLKEDLRGISKKDLPKVIIAYEPVWAIGTGKTATSAQAQEVHKYIRNLLKKMYNQDIANQIRIQYGGSVKTDNIIELMQQPDIDGALVGGASLKIEAFVDIVKKASEIKK